MCTTYQKNWISLSLQQSRQVPQESYPRPSQMLLLLLVLVLALLFPISGGTKTSLREVLFGESGCGKDDRCRPSEPASQPLELCQPWPEAVQVACSLNYRRLITKASKAFN
jgi:hypothetical protein